MSIMQKLKDVANFGQDKQEQGIDLSDRFTELTRQLLCKFDISKGVLVIRRPIDEQLAAISTWQSGVTRDGLTITLPTETSLFDQVAKQGQTYAEDFCDSFSGNFFERRLLLDDDSRSFVVHPLKHEGKVVGLLAFSSHEPTAFAMFEEGDIDHLTQPFAQHVETHIASKF